MKNLSIVISSIIVGGIILFSCTKDDGSVAINNPENTNNQEQLTTFNEMFETIANTELKEDETVLYVSYNWNKNTNEVSITNIIEREPDFFVLATDNDFSKVKYTVECENGDDSWTAECDGKFSCGYKIADCLADGGCATICPKELVYTPQTRTFILKNNE